MIRPFTCICLVLAAGSGLYLYQVKQRAFALDAELRSTFHGIDMAREKTRMLRADWALMNDPERLQALSDQYLTLKPMGPSQLMTLDQLAAALPPPIAPVSTPAPAAAPDSGLPALDPTRGVPMASASPVSPVAKASGPAVALLQPSSTDTVPSASVSTSTDSGSASAVVADATTPDSTAEGASLASAAAASVAAVSVKPQAPSTSPSAAPAQTEVAVVTPHVAHHWTKRTQPALKPWATTGSASFLAEANVPTPKPHHAHQKSAAPKPSTQYFAANESARPVYGGERITPPAATVMYTPVGSSLGMAATAALAPPRPLYSTAQ